jgi:zinc protease
MTTELRPSGTLDVLDRRPAPGPPRPYRFPPFTRHRLDNGLTVISANLPGRPLLAAQLLVEGGAGSEPAGGAGVTSLVARGLSEGTARRDAIAFVEATERLGADVHADAGWETLAASLEVPRSRFGPALALLAEMVLEPSFPEREIERLRDERLNDLLQVRADPRRRVERAFAETIYAPWSPFSRPAAGVEETVERLGRPAVAERHAELLDASRATLIVAGDLERVPVLELVEEHFGSWPGRGSPGAPALDASRHPAGARVVLVDRPDSPQSELRIGHVGLPRRIPDFHAVAVMQTILGGLFNSRLQRLLREARGYTYGIGAGFEFRRAAGPFAVRTAVQTEVTVPAIEDILSQLRGIRSQPVEQAELDEARDYLVGVFPLRFDTSAQVAAAIGGLVVNALPDDELDRYRPAVAAVGADDVLAAATHVRPDDLCVVLVADAAKVEGDLRDAGVGEVSVVTDPLFTDGPGFAAEEVQPR